MCWSLVKALNNEGDFYFLEGVEELQQVVSHVVYTFKGEDPYNVNGGIPYFEKILFQKNLTTTELESYIRNEVKGMGRWLMYF